MLARRRRSEEFRFARFERERPARVGERRSTVDEQARRVQVRRHLRDLERNALELADRAAERDAAPSRMRPIRRGTPPECRPPAPRCRSGPTSAPSSRCRSLRPPRRAARRQRRRRRRTRRRTYCSCGCRASRSRFSTAMPGSAASIRNALTPLAPGPPVRNIPISTPQ